MTTVVVYFAALIVLFGAAAGNDPLVTITQGRLEGITETSTEGKEIFSFLGVPYAIPPLGELRFEEPVPAQSWSGIRNAKTYPDYCLQYTAVDIRMEENPEAKGSEDCLYLNVHTPKLEKGTNLPVMVYIHGGANIRGGAQDYRPYVLLNEDIVLVVIQHRIGVFGFLSTEDYSISGNYAYKDMIVALWWVQENIQEFGGDTSTVTIFGHSSGAMSCQMLTVLPIAEGLFHRAILQSGFVAYPGITEGGHREKAMRTGRLVGCSLNESSEQFKDCIQKVNSLDLFLSYNEATKEDASMLTAMPYVDREILPYEPVSMLKKGHFNKVDVLVGRMREDSGLSVLEIISDLNGYAIWKNGYRFIIKSMEPNLTDEDVEKIANRYFSGKPIERDQWHSFIKFFDELYMDQASYATSYFMNKYPGSSTFQYELNHRGQFSYGDYYPDIEETKNWAIHGDDLFYLFHGGPIHHRPMVDSEDLILRKIITKLWTNFARTGNPTPDDSLGFTWDPITGKDYRFLNLTTSPKMQDKDTEGLEFYASMPMKMTSLMEEESKSIFYKKSKLEDKEEL